MKITTHLILIVIIAGFICCEDGNDNDQHVNLSGNMIEYSTCKSDFKSSFVATTPDTLSCIEYSYDNALSKLTINHINAGFNCCPESLYCDISLINDTIVIEEFEAAALCRCNCLYDLDFVLSGVKAKKYHIKFIEPYLGNQEQLFFEVDLAEDITGSCCVIRKIYPWGEFSLHNEYN